MTRWKNEQPLFYLFFMRLKQRSPKLFYFFLSCCVLQLIFTVLKLEATPFLLYGMYSEKQTVPDTTKIIRVYLDNEPLEKLPLYPREKELLLTGIENYLAMKKNGSVDVVQTRVEQRYPFLTSTSLYPVIRPKIFNDATDLFRFETWFKEKCSRLTNRKIDTITIVENRYTTHPATLAVALVAYEPIASF